MTWQPILKKTISQLTSQDLFLPENLNIDRAGRCCRESKKIFGEEWKRIMELSFPDSTKNYRRDSWSDMECKDFLINIKSVVKSMGEMYAEKPISPIMKYGDPLLEAAKKALEFWEKCVGEQA